MKLIPLILVTMSFITGWHQPRILFGDELINPAGTTLQSRFRTPDGFKRVPASTNSFATYLRQLPMKSHPSEVRLYDGRVKVNRNVYAGVVDLPIGTRDLHQCADAVIRLRAEYLWKEKRYDEIHFNFTNGFRVDYSEWRQGKRIRVEGNSVRWRDGGNPSGSYADFWKYLEIIFSYAGTLSLEAELAQPDNGDIRIGDVFIQGGSPGHAVIVVDMAANELGERIFMLAQSYMPAQEIQVLQNNNDVQSSPWYSADFGNQLKTPEWVFQREDLRRFSD